MTEEEAKTKMCCGPQAVAMALVITAPRGTVELLPNAGLCIGSACAAWRPTQAGWAVIRSTLPGADKEVTGKWSDYEGSVFQGQPCWSKVSDLPAQGFCGLAGAPQ